MARRKGKRPSRGRRAKPLRVYADTSVFGGCFDDEFAEESKRFFQHIAQGKFRLVVSDTTLLELRSAPEAVRRVLANLPPKVVEQVALTPEINDLRDAYVAAGVVGSTAVRDAEHIAAATIAAVDLIVSWNFKHIVHYDKISGYHAVNRARGYQAIPIFSPLEVV